MKQGRASVTNYEPKQEPNSHAVSETAVAQIGLAQGKPGPNIYEGRGYTAPMVGETIHNKGSQGKH